MIVGGDMMKLVRYGHVYEHVNIAIFQEQDMERVLSKYVCISARSM